MSEVPTLQPWKAVVIPNTQVSLIRSLTKTRIGSNLNVRGNEPAQITSEAIEEENFSYREISDLSEATQDNLPGEGSINGELEDYERLLANTQKK